MRIGLQVLQVIIVVLLVDEMITTSRGVAFPPWKTIKLSAKRDVQMLQLALLYLLGHAVSEKNTEHCATDSLDTAMRLLNG